MSNDSAIRHSELILNPDGSVYHLNLLPGDVAPIIILVGDQDRVPMVSRYFDEILVKKSKREFVTHTGRIGNTMISAVSTGIGTDNIDIVINELDALFNIDFSTREVKPIPVQLDFIRVGTSGAVQADIPLDSFLLSRYAMGMDALVRLGHNHGDTRSTEWMDALRAAALREEITVDPLYIGKADDVLTDKFSDIEEQWITITCGGFYGLQGRSLRIPTRMANTMRFITAFEHDGLRVGNLEMETAGIYVLAGMLRHRAVSLNAILANRQRGEFSSNPHETVDRLIQTTLRILSS